MSADHPGTVNVFVYGTLVPGGRSYDVVRRWVQTHRPAVVRGRLYDTGRGYPGATFGDAAGDTREVHGVLLTLDHADAALAHLDAFEGDEYHRVQVRSTDGAVAVAYEWCLPTADLVPVMGGCWPPPKFSA